jgi:osmotically-inducible protein OsmY
MKKDRTVLRMSLPATVGLFGVVMLCTVFIPARPAAGDANKDVQIETAVESVIEEDGHLDLDELRISCHDGVVRLGGTVLTVEERALAELLAMQVPDVRAVQDNIRVERPSDQDVELEKQAESTLLENPLLQITELLVRARHGVVTLHGIARDQGEKSLAGRLLSDLPGVVKVRNKIEVLG